MIPAFSNENEGLKAFMKENHPVAPVAKPGELGRLLHRLKLDRPPLSRVLMSALPVTAIAATLLAVLSASFESQLTTEDIENIHSEVKAVAMEGTEVAAEEELASMEVGEEFLTLLADNGSP